MINTDISADDLKTVFVHQICAHVRCVGRKISKTVDVHCDTGVNKMVYVVNNLDKTLDRRIEVARFDTIDEAIELFNRL